MIRRLFLGIPVSEEIRQKAADVAIALQNTDADIVLVKDFHFTLAFLGNIDDRTLSEIVEKINTIQQNSFQITLHGVGVFPDFQHPRVVWIGVNSSALTELMKKTNLPLKDIVKDSRDEVPHLTIARVKSEKNKEKLQAVLNTFKNKGFGTMLVNSFFLYESTLTPSGPIYNVVHRFTLKSGKE